MKLTNQPCMHCMSSVYTSDSIKLDTIVDGLMDHGWMEATTLNFDLCSGVGLLQVTGDYMSMI